MNGKRQYAAASAINRAAKHAKMDAGSGREEAGSSAEPDEEDLSPLCVGYFMVSCNFTGMLCYVGKFGEDHVVVTEEWYGENPDKVNDEAEWRANAIGSLTRVVYASKEDEEIGGHFVPCEGCDLVETDSEEAGSSAEAGGAKAAAE